MNTQNSISLKKYVKTNIIANEWYRIRTDLFQFMLTCIKEDHFDEKEQAQYESKLEDFTRLKLS